MSEGTIRVPSPTVRTVFMIVVTAGAAICFPAIKLGLAFSPPLRLAGLRTLLAGLALLAATPVMRQRIWLPKRLCLWIEPLGFTATPFTFASMFLSPKFTNTARVGARKYATVSRARLCGASFGRDYYPLESVRLIARLYWGCSNRDRGVWL